MQKGNKISREINKIENKYAIEIFIKAKVSSLKAAMKLMKSRKEA